MSTQLPRIVVSQRNPHLLETEDGKPFFMLGDTAWELLFRLTKPEVTEYFQARQTQKFNMIWLCFLPECDSVRMPNQSGILPLHYEDPLKLNPEYISWTKWVIEEAAKHQLYVGFLPTWGDKITAPWGAGPVLFNDTKVIHQFGELMGQHFGGNTNLLWVLGGDRPPMIEKGSWMEEYAKNLNVNPASDWRPLWSALAEGIVKSSSQKLLTTYHPQGGNESTSKYLHTEPWLDMNCMQSGHGNGRDTHVWENVSRDYAMTPPKPTFDGEPNYEDHPVSPWPTWDTKNGYFDEYDVRRQIWRSVFAGACGVIYGHHSMWNFAGDHHRWINYAKMDWREALQRPGGRHAHHLRELIESSPFFTLIPDQSVLAENGAHGDHKRVLRDTSGTLVLIYCPRGGAVKVHNEAVKGKSVNWFNPRTGKRHEGQGESGENHTTFMTPGDIDWVLILE